MRILIAAKQATLRDALETLLQTRKDLEIVGTAAERKTLFDQVKDTSPDTILLDEDLSKKLLDDVIRPLQKIDPRSKIVILGYRTESKKEMLDAGAAAFVEKGSSPKTLLTTLEGIRLQDNSV